MDGSGIDFVEGGFTSEPAHSGAGRDQARALAFRKWANRTHEVPIKPILIALVIFTSLMGLPWLLDCVQSSKVHEAQQVETTPAPATDTGWTGTTNYGQFGRPVQPQFQGPMHMQTQQQMQQQTQVQPQPRQKVIVTR